MRARLLITLILLALAASACGSSSSTAAASTPASGSPGSTPSSAPGPGSSPSGSGHSRIGPEVPVPAGFPSDVPVYPGAQLTSGASYSASGTTTYGLVWETTDGESQVQAWYATHLNQGDWSTTYSANGNPGYAAGFTRKSSSKVTGILAIATESSTGITSITLSYVIQS